MPGYDQILKVFAGETLPASADTGAVAFNANDNRHYMFSMSSWYIIPNSMEITSVARQAYVSGVLKPGVFSYLSKAQSVSGTVTFWITDNGTSTGNAVFTEVMEDGITVSPYGTSNAYQLGTPVLSADKKKITVSITQAGTVVLGLITTVTAANGVDCRAIIMGK